MRGSRKPIRDQIIIIRSVIIVLVHLCSRLRVGRTRMGEEGEGFNPFAFVRTHHHLIVHLRIRTYTMRGRRGEGGLNPLVFIQGSSEELNRWTGDMTAL
jgi:hypothetical protein